MKLGSLQGWRNGGAILAVFLCWAGDVLAVADTHPDQGTAFAHCVSNMATNASQLTAIASTGFTFHIYQCTAAGSPTSAYVENLDRKYNGVHDVYLTPNSVSGQSSRLHQHNFTAANTCVTRPTYQDIFNEQEPAQQCNNGCLFEATTGSCDVGGTSATCKFLMQPTGGVCGTAPNADPLPTNCIRNESTGAVACDCSVTPNASYCLAPNLPPASIPSGCISNSGTGGYTCYQPGTPPDNSPDPNQTPDTNPNDLPGDTDNDGACEPGEACADNSYRNELLQKILDELRGNGLNTGESAASLLAKAKATLAAEEAAIAGNMAAGASESAVQSAMTGAGSAFSSSISSVLYGGTACPNVSQTLPNGMSFTPDVAKFVEPIRAVNTFGIWMFVLWNCAFMFLTALKKA